MVRSAYSGLSLLFCSLIIGPYSASLGFIYFVICCSLYILPASIHLKNVISTVQQMSSKAARMQLTPMVCFLIYSFIYKLFLNLHSVLK